MTLCGLRWAKRAAQILSILIALNDALSAEANSTKSIERGKLFLQLFDGLRPLTKQRMRINNELVETDGEGSLLIELDQGGVSVELLTDPPDKNLLFKPVVKSGETTQLLLTKTPEGWHQDFEGPSEFSALNEAKLSGERLKISGTIRAEESKVPLANARLWGPGFGEIIANGEGQFEAMVPVELKELTAYHKGYASQKISLDGLDQNSTGPIEVLLPSKSLELDEFLVLAPKGGGSVEALLELRRQTASVADVLGSEQISRSGDSSVASSLTRVAGLTLFEGRYVYVRGLGERYSSALMNGSSLPSPEPARRVVPLDVFPSGIIENLVIQKSYSPNQPGEFGGGAIQIKSKGVPDRFQYQSSVGAGFIEQVSDRQLSYRGGSQDWLGQDDGSRSLPGLVKEALSSGRKLAQQNENFPEGFTADEMTAFSKSFSNTYNVDSRSDSGEVPPNLSLLIGDRLKVGEVKVGGQLSLLYNQQLLLQERRRSNYATNAARELLPQDSFAFTESERQVRGGLTADVGVEIGDHHRISSTNIFVRNSTDEVILREGYSTDTDSDVRNFTLSFTKREMLLRQLHGEHELYGLKDALFSWRWAFSEAWRDQPDYREYTYLRNGSEPFRFSPRIDGNSRTFSLLYDQNQDLGVDQTVPIRLWTKDPAKLKVGWSLTQRTRESDVRRFSFTNPSSGNNPADLERDLETILAPDQRGTNGYQAEDTTRETDNYRANQSVRAGYGMVEVPVTNKVVLHSGARYETSIQQVETFDVFNPSTREVAELQTSNVLPAHGLTYKFADQMQLRLAYSETLSRPDFRELSTSPFKDDDEDVIVVGNSQLTTTVIKNSDLRVEWYPSRGETLSLGVFEKQFTNPIETIIQPGGIRSFDNLSQAQSRGFELELRKKLGFVHPLLGGWTLSANYSQIESQIQLDSTRNNILTSQSRPLQGQSPYVVNLGLFYDWERFGIQSSLLLNRFGERITEVGTEGLPDIYEQSFDQLDFVFSKKMARGFELGLKANNLLNPTISRTQEARPTLEFRRGRSFFVTLRHRI